MEFLGDAELSTLARSLVPPPSAESRRTAGEMDQNGSESSGFISRLGVLERTGAPSEKHVQTPVRAARAVVFESSGAQGSASSQASADDAVVGDSGGKDEAAEATSGWTKRVRVGKAATEREFNPNRKSALEISVREFVECKEGVVVNPTVGKSFDSLDEAYGFYNLYSWESGFVVRFAKSRLNVHRMKCMQKIVCACAVRFTPCLGEIPAKHVVKRWTRDARDILPEDLVMYQNDQGRPKSDTTRHTKLYLSALELVRMGDANVQSYEAAMLLLQQAKAKLAPISAERDGMGVADREAAALADGMGEGELDGDDDVVSSISAPKRKRAMGRPTTSRDKPPYEKPMKRSRFCKICRKEGHKSTTFPDRGDLPKPPRKALKCSNCGVLGHRRSSCGKEIL